MTKDLPLSRAQRESYNNASRGYWTRSLLEYFNFSQSASRGLEQNDFALQNLSLSFQRDRNLSQDGIIGQATRNAINTVLKSKEREAESLLRELKNYHDGFYQNVIRTPNNDLATSLKDFQTAFNTRHRTSMKKGLLEGLLVDGELGRKTRAALRFEAQLQRKALRSFFEVFQLLKSKDASSYAKMNVAHVSQQHTIREFQLCFNRKYKNKLPLLKVDGVIGTETMSALVYELAKLPDSPSKASSAIPSLKPEIKPEPSQNSSFEFTVIRSFMQSYSTSAFSLDVFDYRKIELPNTNRLENNLSGKAFEVYLEVELEGRLQVVKKKLYQSKDFAEVFTDGDGREWVTLNFKKDYLEHGIGKSKNNPLKKSRINVVDNTSNLRPTSGSFLMPSPAESGENGIVTLEKRGFEVVAILGSGFIDANKAATGYKFLRGDLSAGLPDYEYEGRELEKYDAGYYSTLDGKTHFIDFSAKSASEIKSEIEKLKANQEVLSIHILHFESLQAPEFGQVQNGTNVTQYNVPRSFLSFNEEGTFLAHTVTNSIIYSDQKNVASQTIPGAKKLIALDGDYYARRKLYDPKIPSTFSRDEAVLSSNPVFLVRRKTVFTSPKAQLVSQSSLEAKEKEALEGDDKRDLERLWAQAKANPLSTFKDAFQKAFGYVAAAVQNFFANLPEIEFNVGLTGPNWI